MLTESLFPINFSATMLSDLHLCELLWYRKHCQKLVGQARSGDLIAGGLVAKACELTRKAFFNDGKDAEDSIDIGKTFILEAEDTTHDLKSNERVAMCFERYFKKFKLTSELKPVKLEDGTYAIEYLFNFDLGIPHPEIVGQNICLKGKLDGLYWRKTLAGIENYVLDEKTTGSIRRLPDGTPDWYAEENEFNTSAQFICLTPEHEVLTREGWISIGSKPDREIMCWEQGNLFFDTPYNYVEKEFEGELVSFSGQIEILGTEDHRQVVFDRKYKSYKTYTLDTIPTPIDQYQFITGGNISKTTSSIDVDLLCLLVAAQADGCWVEDRGNLSMVWTFSKQNKIDRLEQLLCSLGFQYSKHRYKSDYYSTGSYTSIRLIGRVNNNTLLKFLTREKLFGYWLLDFEKKLLLLFIKELIHWDGHYIDKNRWCYTSTNKHNIDMVQTVASLCGYLGNIQINGNNRRNQEHAVCYNIYLTSRIHKAVTRHSKSYVPYKGKVYCPNVKSSYFLVRYKGKISVTGNCYHWAARKLGVKTTRSLIRRIPILVKFEESFELSLPINQFMLDRWEQSTIAKIQELISKYKWLKANGGLPQQVFYPIYNEGCNNFKKPCYWKAGCISKEGEEEIASKTKQVIYIEGKEIALIDYKKSLNLI